MLYVSLIHSMLHCFLDYGIMTINNKCDFTKEEAKWQKRQ